MRAARSRPIPPWIEPTIKLRRSKLCASEPEVNFCRTDSVDPPHAHQPEPVGHGDYARDDGEQHDREHYLRRDDAKLYGRELGARKQRGDDQIRHQDARRGQPVEPEIAPWKADIDEFDGDQREREQQHAASEWLTRIEVIEQPER